MDRDRLRAWSRQHEAKLFLFVTLVIGAFVGIVITAFVLLTQQVTLKLYPRGGTSWTRFVVPVIGALVTGYLLERYFPNARGSGIPQTKVALFVRGGRIRLRTVVGKFFCSSASLASGIALGREGPSVQIGAGIASQVGQKLGFGSSKLKALIPVGTAAAIAAAFNTPIAAVLFTMEEVIGDLHAPVLGSIVLSSATAWMVLHMLLGDEPLFHVPNYQLVHPAEFGVYAVLGVFGGLCSVAFVKLTLTLRSQFFRYPKWTRSFQPVAGGLTVGIMGFFIPEVLGVGYNYVSQVLNNAFPFRLMAALIVLKLIATAVCYSSGNAGGIFGPSLFLGAVIGGTVGGVAHNLFPGHTALPGAYALVGMGTAFAGIVRTPLTSVFMIFEITRDYTIVVPLMISNLISYYVSSKLQPTPIYEALAEQDGIHLPSGTARVRKVFTVQQAMDTAVQLTAPDTKIRALLSTTDPLWLIGVQGSLWGILRRTEVEAAAESDAGRKAGDLVAAPPKQQLELTQENFPHVHIDHTLETALHRMGETGLTVLPVVDRANVRALKGVVTLDGVMRAYKLETTGKVPAA